MKKCIVIVSAVALALVIQGTAAAHVTVKPGDALTGAFQNFTVGVPTEKDVPTVSVKLDIPAGLQNVSPNVKPGWTIDIEKEGEGESAKVKSITWSGGSIPAGFRDEFVFSAKTPAEKASLQWKAYQTYEDGQVVAWDRSKENQPKKADGSPDFSASGPFSTTVVAAQSSEAPNDASNGSDDKAGTDATARLIALAGLAAGLASFAVATRKQKQPAAKK